MEDALLDIEAVADFLHNFIKHGPPKTVAKPPEDIVYVSGLCILMFFGTLGNILILIMFSKKEFSGTSYSIYIRAAAVSDTIFMLMHISEDVMDSVTSYTTMQFLGTSYQVCIFWTVTKGTFRSASPWIVVALALDRCVAIWNPLHRTCYCTKKVAKIITTSIGLASLGVELGLAVPFTTSRMGGFYPVCVITWMSGEVTTIKRLVSDTGLPCITMLIPNLLVIFKIQQSLGFRRSFSTTNDQRGKVAKSARPLLVVSCLAFITLLPISITEMVELAKMKNAAVDYYDDYNHDYYDSDDYYFNDDFHHNDYPSELNRNNSLGRIFDDRVFNFPNDIFENITRNSSDEHDKGVNSDLIESTNLESDEERNINSDLIESTGGDFEDVDDGGLEMNEYDMENRMNENQDQDQESENFVHETEDHEYPDDEEGEIDSVWKACNFIYMFNFCQNFYLLILSSKRYRSALLKMFYCERNKPNTAEIQPQTETISSSLDT